MRIRHYYNFGERLTDKMPGDKLSQSAWDILRTDEVDGPFALEGNREDYEANCSTNDNVRKKAEIIVNILQNNGLVNGDKICSLGCGKAILEWHIKNLLPNNYLCCTDYTRMAIEKLQNLFVRCEEFRTFDMVNDDFKEISGYKYLIMHRISTEFDYDTWISIFERMHKANIENICFIPTEFATEEDAVREERAHKRRMEKGQKDIFCGWLYSQDEFEAMFEGKYKISELERIENTGIYLLTRKSD